MSRRPARARTRRLAGLALALFAVAASSAQELSEHYYRYVQALLAQDREAARAAWWPADLAFAERLGLRWQAVAPKIDAESPLLHELDRLRDGSLSIAVASLDPAGELEVLLHAGADSVRHRVVAQHDGERWWLRHPVLQRVENWPYEEFGALRIVRQPGLEPDTRSWQRNLEFVRSAAQRLELDAATLHELDSARIHIVLADDATLRELVGVPTEGVANVALDMLLTRHPFHPHEIAHLLHGLALGERIVPMHPLLQEGLAVWLGGRFDSEAQAQLEFGALVLDHKLIELDALLEAQRFGREPADFGYAASALVVDVLLERIGMPLLLGLSRTLRTDEAAAETRQRLLAACAWSAADFQRALRRRVVQLRRQGFQNARLPRREPDWQHRSDAASLRLWWQGRQLIGLAEFLPQEDFGRRLELEFAELPERRLRIQAGEIGYYDLPTDRRLAKRAFGFDPDPEFWDAARGRLVFAIALERLGIASAGVIRIHETTE